MQKQYIAYLVCISLAHGEIVDRISVVVEKRAIKASDIAKDICLIDFLNHEKPSFNAEERKKAAARLIDQALIRKELSAGLYSSPDQHEVETLLQQLKQQFGPDAAYQRALASYGIKEPELRAHLNWQLTVLRFINTRFAAGIQVDEQDTRSYYQQHLQDFRRAGKAWRDLDTLRPEIEQAVRGERVNQQFFAWLDEAEKSASITYNEPDLK
jgi:hypothetical protein